MNISETFGCLVFNDQVMKTALPRDTYKALKSTINNGVPLSPDVAKVVANSMKTWAIEKGATHYTHWFQPMTGVTAEKHDSFVTPSDEGVIMSFSGTALIRSEPDASSFPSGGLRDTFETRGYTAWDPTSYVFIKNGVLCIPSAFYSYSGEALDKKTPLLRSMEVLNKQALRIVRLLGDTTATKVNTTVGVEQEFFLLDQEVYNRRPDLAFTGRTLFGAKPPRGQELDDHYLGTLKPRVSAFLKDLSHQLWQFGIYAKTHHNETAPAQHELACEFTTGNISADQNQLVMETIKSLAKVHGMEALLHEKPFAGVNGSGKHNNWSMATDTGINLLEPGKNPHANKKFLLFLCAVIKAVDIYGPLLRASVASASCDHRLGTHEAPPAIISVYLGHEITEILASYASGKPYTPIRSQELSLGVQAMALLPKDTTDRNRTSPFAFTGNKFEFRMPGSATSISEANFIINTMVAEVLEQFADQLEQASDPSATLDQLIAQTYQNHQRIIFNGNNYSTDWVQEAARRGLANLPTTVDALPQLITPQNIALFEKHSVLTEAELRPRCDILLQDYVKHINIEAVTMVGMTQRQIIPAALRYQQELATLLLDKQQLGIDSLLEKQLLDTTSTLCNQLANNLSTLKAHLQQLGQLTTPLDEATHCKDYLLTHMLALRHTVDQLEEIVPDWPFPSYAKMLHSV